MSDSSFAFSGLNLEEYQAKIQNVTHVNSLPLGSNSDGALLFDDLIHRLYKWPSAPFNDSNASWHLYIPTAEESSDPSSNYPSAVIGYHDDATGVSSSIKAEYAGPASAYFEWSYIYSGDHKMAFSTNAPNVFVHGGTGTDAIQVKTGRNVLDGGLGSNFLVGGDGIDTFFVDARGSGNTWSTLVNFHAQDTVTLWGFDLGKSVYSWDESSGAAGAQGATLRADTKGVGQIDASITFAGLTLDQAKKLQVSTGVQPGGQYLYLSNPGV